MVPLKTNVSFCSISKNGRTICAYSNGDRDTENLASLCLSMAPPHHRWYIQTAARTTIGFLMDDGYIYFVIARERDNGLCNSPILKFLHQLRDDFTRSASLRSLSLQERLHPVARRSIASLEKINSTPSPGRFEASSFEIAVNHLLQQQSEGSFSIEAPLLGKSVEIEDACGRLSLEIGGKSDSTSSSHSVAERSNRISSVRRRWCRLVLIILAIDAGICTVLLIIWLFISSGIQ